MSSTEWTEVSTNYYTATVTGLYQQFADAKAANKTVLLSGLRLGEHEAPVAGSTVSDANDQLGVHINDTSGVYSVAVKSDDSVTGIYAAYSG